MRSLLRELGIPIVGQRGWYVVATVRARAEASALAGDLSFMSSRRHRSEEVLQLNAARRKAQSAATFVCGPVRWLPDTLVLTRRPDVMLHAAPETWRVQVMAIRWGPVLRLRSFRAIEFKGHINAGDSAPVELEVTIDVDDRHVDTADIVGAVRVAVRAHTD